MIAEAWTYLSERPGVGRVDSFVNLTLDDMARAS